MIRKKFIPFNAALAIIVLIQIGCSKVDQQPRVDFYIDTNQYTTLQLTGGFIYINGVIIFKGLDGNYYALSEFCTYDNTELEYQVSYDRLYCPNDGSLFNIDGSVAMAPAQAPLYQYATSTIGTQIHVYTP